MVTDFNIKPSNDNVMNSSLERLYDFHFKNRVGQLSVYSTAFILSVLYMIISDLSPTFQRNSIVEGIIIATLIIIFMPFAFIYEIPSLPNNYNFSIGETKIYELK